MWSQFAVLSINHCFTTADVGIIENGHSNIKFYIIYTLFVALVKQISYFRYFGEQCVQMFKLGLWFMLNWIWD